MPQDQRSAVLSPADHWGMLGSQTALYMQEAAKDASAARQLGMIGGVTPYTAQNVQAHTSGAGGATGAPGRVNGASQNSPTTAAENTATMSQSLITATGANETIKAGRRLHHRRRVRGQPGHQGDAGVPAAVRGARRRDHAGGRRGDAHDLAADHHLGRVPDRELGAGRRRAITMHGAAASGPRAEHGVPQERVLAGDGADGGPPGAVDVARRAYKGIPFA